MARSDRRNFLKKAAASTGSLALLNVLPEPIRKAMAIPACSGSGTLDDVEHIVVLMQENRSFDHYLGHLSGVRGYNDRFPIRLAGKRPVWFQPRNDALRGVIAPFHLDTRTTSAQCIGDLDHTWQATHAAFNEGRYDAWPRNKTDMTMGFYLRGDIPFHYALADAFTVCDHYFCSFPGPTHPNRMFLMTGTIDPSGGSGGPLIDNHDAILEPGLPAFTWMTYPERLEKAGISWQVYQEGTDFRDKYGGNLGLNVLSGFEHFINALEGSALWRKAMTARSLTQLADDARRNTLPQVSWLLPPAAFSEHPRWTPAYGATYIARVLDALTVNPLVWSKTVLFVLYDENDGFFDHVVPPQPPANPRQGKSTVAVQDELHTVVNPLHNPEYEVDGLPYGLGPRVPMTVVSPWSKGGFVCSQVFDHTSIIRFIERRFGVVEPNISAWRRAVCGDLTAALDFTHCDRSVPVLPDTQGYRALADKQCRALLKPSAPAVEVPAFQAQEPGIRPARPLPYDLYVRDSLDIRNKRLRMNFDNRGGQGVHFWVRADDAQYAPKHYTVEAGKSLSDDFPATLSGNYAWTVYGPNGFVRMMKGVISSAGSSDTAQLGMEAHYDSRKDILLVEVRNQSAKALSVRLTDAAYNNSDQAIALAPQSSHLFTWKVKDSGYWYDTALSVAEYPGYIRRFAGHIETGRASCTDPAAHAPVLV